MADFQSEAGNFATPEPPSPRWTLPNRITLGRLLAAPLLGVVIVVGDHRFFSGLLLLSLLSDILDGWLARRLGLQSAFGARLDSWADTATTWVGIAGLLRFGWAAIQPRLLWILLFSAASQLLNLAMLLKFRRIVGLHTWSYKLAAYLLGAAALLVLWTGRWSPLGDLALGWGLVACLEELLIVAVLREPLTDVRGLYWVLRGCDSHTAAG